MIIHMHNIIFLVASFFLLSTGFLLRQHLNCFQKGMKLVKWNAPKTAIAIDFRPGHRLHALHSKWVPMTLLFKIINVQSLSLSCVIGHSDTVQFLCSMWEKVHQL